MQGSVVDVWGSMDVLKSLKYRSSQELFALAALFNKQGIVSDEDGPWISSTMIEHWSERCDDLLRDHGYTGGKLEVYAKYFSSHGNIYSLFDSGNFTPEDAANYVQAVSLRP